MDFVCKVDSVNLNVERMIDTEHETRDEPLLSSLT